MSIIQIQESSQSQPGARHASHGSQRKAVVELRKGSSSATGKPCADVSIDSSEESWAYCKSSN